MQPKLSILICALGRRNEKLTALCQKLSRQIKDQPVEVLVCWDNFEDTVAIKRQALLDAASGEYVCFIDDDDDVPDYYIEKILPLLDGVDYIGWRMQLYVNGEAQKPTYHSLKYDKWSEDDNGYYRNVSHLNPMRREIAMQGKFDVPKGTAEDVAWVTQVHPQTEHYIDEPMYFYRSNPGESLWTDSHAVEGYGRPLLPIVCSYIGVRTNGNA